MNSVKPGLYDEMYLLAKSLLQRGEQGETIEKELLRKSDDIVLVTVVMKEARNDYYTLLRKEGFRLILAGSVMSFSGVLITCINFNTSRSIDFAMYGLTTLGVALVFWGLFKLIG